MTFLLVIWATLWIWEFLDNYIPVPDYISYSSVPFIAYVLFLLPHMAVTCMAVAGLVGIAHRLVTLPRVARQGHTEVPRRRSNIPPLP